MKMVIASLAMASAICMSPTKIAAAGVRQIDLVKLCKKRGFEVTIVKGDRTGIYHGRFVGPGSYMQHTLIVRQVNGSKATVLYAHGKWSQYRIRNGCSKHTGVMKGDVLKIKFRNGNTVEYKFFDKDGFATGSYRSSGGTTHGRIDKANRSN